MLCKTIMELSGRRPRAHPIRSNITVHCSLPEVTSFIQTEFSGFMPERPDAGEI